MNQSFVDYFRKFRFLSFSDLKLIYSIASIKKVQAEQLLVREGETFYHVIIILKGLVRNYVITSKGEERTTLLAKEGMQVATPESLFSATPSFEFIEAVEPSILVYIDSRKFNKLIKKHPNLLLLKSRNMEKAIVKTINRVRFFTLLSPEERFIELQNKYPEFIQRVPQKYLASFIGVTTVSFSRIKARVYLKRK